MKRNMIFVLILASVLFPSLGRGEPPRTGPYVAWFIGASVPQNQHADSYDTFGSYNDRVEFDPGINVGGSAGYDFGYVRFEGELSYKYGDISSIYDTTSGIKYGSIHGSIGVFSAMANCFIDLHNSSPVTPYLGGGIGVASLYLGDTSGVVGGRRYMLYESDDDTVFAYQAGAGLEIALTRYISLDVGYRYFATDKAKFDEGTQGTRMKFESHSGIVGFKFKF